MDEPASENLDDIVDISLGERLTHGDLVPFLKTPATARAGSVLRDEGRMISHRRLAAIVDRVSVGQSCTDEIPCMCQNGV